MAFCKNCGAQLPEDTKFCASCGAKVAGTTADDIVGKFTNTPDYTANYSQEDINDSKVFCVLAYLGLLFLVPLLARGKSPFARFHTNQGIVLFVFDIVAGIVAALLSFIPVLGWILNTIIGLFTLALLILGIVNAANGKAKELPFIGKILVIK